MQGRTIFGGLFVAAGIMAIAMFDWSSTLTCDRSPQSPGSCQLVRRNGLGSREQTLPLSRLQGARVETKQVELSSDRLRRTTPMYRVVLLATDSAEIPLTAYYTGDRASKEGMVFLISTFLEDSAQTSLTIRQSDRQRVFLVGGLLIVLGIAILRLGR